MKRAIKVIVVFILAVSFTFFCAKSKKVPQEKVETVTGVVRMIGSHPFEKTVITLRNAEKKVVNYYITGKLKQKLQKHIYKTVTVKGTLQIKRLSFAGKRKRKLLKHILEVESFEVKK